ncbi:hypothetical protein HYV74_01400 [Candidatus Uhrbacteria bacterium]|nr:hypothetical protein [Candidatus Uhrbacteria bacterium]
MGSGRVDWEGFDIAATIPGWWSVVKWYGEKMKRPGLGTRPGAVRCITMRCGA